MRILLLLGFAVFLYSRFDVLWTKFTRWAKPQNIAAPINTSLPQWAYNRDSTQASLQCGMDFSPCRLTAEKLRRGLGSQAGALMSKAKGMHSLQNLHLSGIVVTFPDSSSELSPELEVVSGSSLAGLFNYRRMKNNRGMWCDDKNGCLTPNQAHPPMQGNMEPVDGWIRLTSTTPEVHAALPGKVIKRDSISPAEFNITLYHGRELYTRYQHLNLPASGLAVGHTIRSGQSLGIASAIDSTRFMVRFRAERSGLMQDLFASAEVSREP